MRIHETSEALLHVRQSDSVDHKLKIMPEHFDREFPSKKVRSTGVRITGVRRRSTVRGARSHDIDSKGSM